MEALAKHNFARISPQKARLVADLIRGKSVDQALEILTFSNKKAAALVKKVLESAIANAEHNDCLLYTSPSPRDREKSRMPSSA